MTPPLIPLPDTVLLHADSTLLLELTQTYHDFLPPHEPVPAVDTPPLTSRKGLFDALTEPAATRQRSPIDFHRPVAHITCLVIEMMTIPV